MNNHGAYPESARTPRVRELETGLEANSPTREQPIRCERTQPANITPVLDESMPQPEHTARGWNHE